MLERLLAPGALAVATALTCVALGVAPRTDRVTWAAENAPVFVALPLLIRTHQRFRFTDIAYRLMFVHALVLIVGGHYSYAEVPIGDWARDAFGLARNPYDRLGHLMQGFVPAIVARELLLRTSPLRPGGWLFALVTLSCLGISAAYELVEWWSAELLADGAVAFLGSQGDPWDAQWDMFCALSGAIAAQSLLGRTHDRAIAALTGSSSAPTGSSERRGDPRGPRPGL